MNPNSSETSTHTGDILEWMAPSRPFVQRTREFYRTVASIAFLIIVILFFVREFLLILVILATLFVMYVLSTVPPEQIKNKITTLGIQTGEHFHKWEEMRTFWFDDKHGSRVLAIGLYLNFPTHLLLLIEPAHEAHIKKILSEHIPFQEKPERTFLDNAATWLSSKIPLEKAT